jgi:Flp pilus assembly protein TadD
MLVLVLLVVAAFGPCLGNDFVAWDDEANFLKNPFFRGLGWSQLYWDWTSFRIGVYQPLAWMLLGSEYLLFGLSPWGYHLTNLGLYALDTVVLLVLTIALLVRCQEGPDRVASRAMILGAGLAVALYAVHPLRTEVVVWASCQPHLCCALFAMLAVLAYLHAFPEGVAPRRAWLFGAFGLFTVALLCKAYAVTLPAVLLILDVYPLRRLGGGPGRWFGPAVRTVWWEKTPFVVLSLLFVGLAIVGREQSRYQVSVQNAGLPARLAQACYGIGFYPIKTVLPWGITAFYPVPERVVWYEFPFVVSILGTLGVSVGVFLWRSRHPGLAAAWLSYLVILAPNLGLIPVGNYIAADRYSYIAMLGVVVLLAAGLARICQAAQRSWATATALSALGVGVLLCLILLSREQSQIWRSSEALWVHALSHEASRSHIAHNNLGRALERQGRFEEARREFTEAVRLNPDYAEAHSNLGLILGSQGRFAEARAEFSEALRLKPTFADAHINLGVVLIRQGEREAAEAEFTEALRLQPDAADAHYNLGVVLLQQGRLEPARAEFSETLRLDPEHARAHANLGVVLLNQGRLPEAQSEFSEALRLRPDPADARAYQELVLKAKERLNQARGRAGDVSR